MFDHLISTTVHSHPFRQRKVQRGYFGSWDSQLPPRSYSLKAIPQDMSCVLAMEVTSSAYWVDIHSPLLKWGCLQVTCHGNMAKEKFGFSGESEYATSSSDQSLAVPSGLARDHKPILYSIFPKVQGSIQYYHRCYLKNDLSVCLKCSLVSPEVLENLWFPNPTRLPLSHTQQLPYFQVIHPSTVKTQLTKTFILYALFAISKPHPFR